MKAVIVYWIDSTNTNFKMSDEIYKEFHNWLFLSSSEKPFEASREDKTVFILKSAIKYIQVSNWKESEEVKML